MNHLNLVLQKYYHEGDFLLSSGQWGTDYLDLWPYMLNPEGRRVLSQGLYNCLMENPEIQFDCVGGMEMASLPMAMMISDVFSVPAFVVRKTRKPHGTKKLYEGDKPFGRILLCDDVLSTRQSVMNCVRILRNHCCDDDVTFAGIIAICDRGESSWNTEIPVISLTNIEDIRRVRPGYDQHS